MEMGSRPERNLASLAYVPEYQCRLDDAILLDPNVNVRVDNIFEKSFLHGLVACRSFEANPTWPSQPTQSPYRGKTTNLFGRLNKARRSPRILHDVHMAAHAWRKPASEPIKSGLYTRKIEWNVEKDLMHYSPNKRVSFMNSARKKTFFRAKKIARHDKCEIASSERAVCVGEERNLAMVVGNNYADYKQRGILKKQSLESLGPKSSTKEVGVTRSLSLRSLKEKTALNKPIYANWATKHRYTIDFTYNDIEARHFEGAKKGNFPDSTMDELQLSRTRSASAGPCELARFTDSTMSAGLQDDNADFESAWSGTGDSMVSVAGTNNCTPRFERREYFDNSVSHGHLNSTAFALVPGNVLQRRLSLRSINKLQTAASLTRNRHRSDNDIYYASDQLPSSPTQALFTRGQSDLLRTSDTISVASASGHSHHNLQPNPVIKHDSPRPTYSDLGTYV